MIRAGAGLRKTEGDVHRFVEIQQFQRDQSLVVIHREDRIVFPQRRIAENGIRNVRAGEGGESGFVEGGDGGSDDGFLLIAESAVFPGMGIQAADGDTWGGDACFREEIRRELADGKNRFDGEQARNIGERIVRFSGSSSSTTTPVSDAVQVRKFP